MGNRGCKIGKVTPKLRVIENKSVSPFTQELREAIEASEEYPVESLCVVMHAKDSIYLSYVMLPEGDITSLLGGLEMLKTKILRENYISRS